ncbi:MAG: hypothetical protein JNM63_06410, partial [Spirochaetia bacterium]|nr:hypothetical protein [Spirochaetia bacterium]
MEINHNGKYSGMEGQWDMSAKDSLSISKLSQTPTLARFSTKQDGGDAYHLEGLRGKGDAKMQLKRAAE